MLHLFIVLLQVVNLMLLDCKRAVHLLIQHRDIIPPYEVVEQLLHASKSCDKKYLLHQYLHALFEVDIHAGKDYHDMQVCGFSLDILSLYIVYLLILPVSPISVPSISCFDTN